MNAAERFWRQQIVRVLLVATLFSVQLASALPISPAEFQNSDIFAPAWDVFSQNPVLFVDGARSTPTVLLLHRNTVRLTYHTAYLYNINHPFADAWMPFSLEGEPSDYHGFLHGDIISQIPAELVAPGVSYVAVHYCTHTLTNAAGAQRYACGCSGTTLEDCGKWNLERFEIPDPRAEDSRDTDDPARVWSTSTDPFGEFPNSVTPQAYVDEPPVEIEPLTFTGELQLIAVDDFDSYAEDLVVIQEIGGEERMRWIDYGDVDSLPELGSFVTISGMDDGRTLVVSEADAIELVSAAPQLSSEPELAPKGERRLLVMLVTMPYERNTQMTREDIHTVIFTGEYSTANFWKQQTRGAITITGDVTEWMEIDVGSRCPESTIRKAADKAAVKAGYAVSNYHHKMYIFPHNPRCSFRGLGQYPVFGGAGTWTMINLQPLTHFLPSHELGHNFGLGHSKGIDCGEHQSCVSPKIHEYGHVHDVMGTGYGGSLNIMQRRLKGWESHDRILTVTEPGIYRIDTPLGSDGYGIKAIQVLPPGYQGISYVLEYRAPIGFDVLLAESAHRGATVMQHAGTSGGRFTIRRDNSYLVDTTPKSVLWGSDFEDAQLADGRSFIDYYRRVQIKQLSHTDTSVTVEVLYGSPESCIGGPPTIRIFPLILESKYPSRFPVYFSITNSDPLRTVAGPCPSSRFDFRIDAPDAINFEYVERELELDPGATASFFQNVGIVESALPGAYTYSVTVSKKDVPSIRSVEQATVLRPDRPAPIVHITEPQDGARVWCDVFLSYDVDIPDGLSESDVGGTSHYLNGRFRGGTFGMQNVFRHRIYGLPEGLHTLMVQTQNHGGEDGSHEISVHVVHSDVTPPNVEITSFDFGEEIAPQVHTLEARADDNCDVWVVHWNIGDEYVAYTDRPPYRAFWDATSLPSGRYTIRALAYDTNMNWNEHTIDVFLRSSSGDCIDCRDTGTDGGGTVDGDTPGGSLDDTLVDTRGGGGSDDALLVYME